ncbi:MAG: Guanylate kinase [Flavobacteriaceae bacterium]|nr:MAG: Guanylate kinase [Flavobacteriaceae bacterium]
MSSDSGKLVVFSAPSGSGKTTLVHHLLQQGLPIGFSISATSRPPRGKEKDGVDYFFMSENSFREKIAENAFLEYEEVYEGTFYGTLRSEVDRLWKTGKTVLFDIDVVGGLNVKRQYPDQCLALFIQPPSLSELEKRLRGRGTDNEKKIKERLTKATKELDLANQFDKVIVNDDLETAKEEVGKAVHDFLES